MGPIPFLVLGFLVQDPVSLEIGTPISGTVDQAAEEVHTPILDQDYSDAINVGIRIPLQVPESGDYFIDLRSYDFDAYLILLNESGEVVGENDDGMLGPSAFLTCQLEAGHPYQVVVCALHGERGEFKLELGAGLYQELIGQERWQAMVDDWHARADHVEGKHGKQSADYATVINLLGVLYFSNGDYDKAREYWQGALDIRLQVLGPEHPDTSTSLNNLGALLASLGDYEAALPLYEQGLALDEKLLGPEHPDTATTLNNLATLYQFQGYFEKARPLLERAVAISEKVKGPEDSETAVALSGLAQVMLSLGDHAGAEPLFWRALAIHEKVHGEDHPLTATSLNNLALLLTKMGDYPQALPLMERSLAAQEKILGPEHPDTALALMNLSYLCMKSSEVPRAKSLLERTLTIYLGVYGEYHPDTANTLTHLGAMHRRLGDWQATQDSFERALAIYQKVLGSEHPSTSKCLSQLAGVKVHQGKAAEATALYLQSLQGSLQYLDRELPTLSESGRLRLLEVTSNPEDLLDSLLAMKEGPIREVYSWFLQWKGKATRLQQASIRLGLANVSEKIEGQRNRIKAISDTLSSLILLPLSQQHPNQAEQILALRAERLQLEREVNRELGIDQVITSPELISIQKSIPADTILIDFFVGEKVYAWVVATSGDPTLIPLGRSADLRRLQEEFLSRRISRGGAPLQASDTSKEYLQALWGPLAGATQGMKNVWISPDGFLCELPFGVLQQAEGKFLLEEFQFHYFSDPSQALSLASPAATEQGPLLVIGNVNYFRRDQAPSGISTVNSSRSRVGSAWNSLPATRDELQSIRDLHQYILEWESPLTVVEGKAATEERIRQELPGYRYVHIATHGYFEPDHLPSLLYEARAKVDEFALEEQVEVAGLLPGLLSGLVFAGVNSEPDPTRDDGYLSAEEIQHLDLSACELVVLSACETALGSARAGEGLMSLRRAFSVAGADTVVSSLWKVDDQATAQLMKDFYSNLWEKGMSRGDALHQAKLRMLYLNRAENGGDAMANHWGAFVLSGSWQ